MSDGNELYLVQSTMLKSLYKIGISKDPYARYDQLDEIGQGLERFWSNTQSEWFKLPRKDVDRLTEFLYEVEEPDYTTVDLVNFLNHNTLKQEPTNE
jgi:hypothetical protein